MVHIRLGENSFLITGDTMKKFDDNNVEAVDEMLTLYAEEYSPVTVLKYVHHGHARQTSADCMLALKPQNLIFTAYEPNCVGYMMKKYPDITERVNFYINNNQAIVFECTAEEKLTPPDCMIKN